jgi:hypothetical protein
MAAMCYNGKLPRDRLEVDHVKGYMLSVQSKKFWAHNT